MAADESIMRLQRPIDILQLHWPPSLQWQEATYLKTFDDLVEAKKAIQLGVSNYGPKNLKRIMKQMSNSKNKIKTNQVQFSLLSRYPLSNGLIEVCQENDIQLIGYSPLALGLLTDKYTLDR
jgi:pyridoxine 4-dehydrogenase